MGEIIFNLCIIGMCIVCYINLTMNAGDVVAYDTIGPTAWPKLLCILIIVFVAAGTLLKLAAEKKNPEKKERLGFDAVLKELIKGKMLRLILLIAVYLFILRYIGFVFATPLFIFISTLIMGQKNTVVRIIFAVLVTVLLFAVFDKLLGVALPRGVGVFRSIALALESL